MTASAFAQTPDAYRASRPAKVEGIGTPLAPTSSGVTGDDFSNPIVIESLPYTVTGNTCSFLNNVEGTCGGTGPEVVYAFTPTQNICATISLCDPFTNFDTVLDLYLSSSTRLLKCSDDICGIQSEIAGVTLFAGNTYYIVVDGYGGSCGDYQLKITLCDPPCNIAFPPGASPEGEPICADGSADTFNAGCNSNPPTSTDVPCGYGPVSLSGHYGNFTTGGVNFRDTDWYRVVSSQPTTLVATVSGEVNTVLAIVDMTDGCGSLVERCPQQFASPCTPVTCSAQVPAGTHFVFVAPADFVGTPCSAKYVLTVSGTSCTTGVKPMSWGVLKARYR